MWVQEGLEVLLNSHCALFLYPPSSWGLSVFTAPGKGLTSCRWDLGELRVENPWRVKGIHSLSLLGVSDPSLSPSLTEEGGQNSPLGEVWRWEG